MKDFIEVYDNALTPEMCKEIMEFFDGAPPELKHSGQVYKDSWDISVDKSYKDSTDVWMNFHNWTEPDKMIASTLLTHIGKYREVHPEIDNVSTWELAELYNIQKYEPEQAYHAPHCECLDGTTPRILAWMLYLNTVTDKGGTHFTNYDITTDAVEGRLVIWPAYWTHTHHGIASPTQIKYIATGWYEFAQKGLQLNEYFDEAVKQSK